MRKKGDRKGRMEDKKSKEEKKGKCKEQIADSITRGNN